MTISSIKKIFAVFTVLLLQGCLNPEEETKPHEAFDKVYHNEDSGLKLYPVSLIQTQEDDYILLSAANEWDTYITKTDNRGEREWSGFMGSPYVNPVAPIMEKDGKYYFFCMDEVALSTYLVQINMLEGKLKEVNNYNEIIYPLSAQKLSDGGFLLESYDRNTRSTQITKIGSDFQVVWKEKYNVLEDVEQPVINHIRRQERLSFFVDEVKNGDNYFFNGFYNFSFSTVFIDAEDGKEKGAISGFRYEGAVSSATHIADSNFALARYTFGENYFLPKEGINQNNVAFSGDMGGNPMLELEEDARVKVRKIQAGKKLTVFGSTTKSRQIVIHVYDANSGQLKGTRYFGETNPYDFVDFVKTGDGGLAILGQTFVANRFAREALFKISKKELEELGD